MTFDEIIDSNYSEDDKRKLKVIAASESYIESERVKRNLQYEISQYGYNIDNDCDEEK